MNPARIFNQRAALLLFVLAAICVICSFGSRRSDAQSTVTPIPITNATTTAINNNNSPDKQYRPRISGDYVSYAELPYNTNTTDIRYHNLLTNSDGFISSGDLSDISGTNIVFERTGVVGSTIIGSIWLSSIFGPPVELAPTPTPSPIPKARILPTIGSNIVAWEEDSYANSNLGPVPTSSEIMAYDLVTSQLTAVTNDGLFNQCPAMYPNGLGVVWIKCDSSGSKCDIWQATPLPWFPFWTATQLTNTSDIYGPPATDGGRVVYERAGHIRWRYLGPGSPENELPSNGSFQTNPQISGNLIVFTDNSFDIDLYDLTTNKLYQVTNTSYPSFNTDHADVSVSPTGEVRVVYESQTQGNLSPKVNLTTFYLKKFYTNRNSFTQNAGKLTTINFDQTACSAPIDVSPPLAPVSAQNVYSPLGLTFFPTNQIKQETSLATSSPNILFDHPILNQTSPNRLISGSFASAVHAVGFNNVGSAATLRIYDGSFTLLGSSTVPQGGFIGITSQAPISSFQIAGDTNLAVDDLLFSQIVTTLDCTAPEMTLPPDTTVEATSASGAVVTYVVKAFDGIDPNPTVSCKPPSGSTFPMGVTTVTCTATDASGNGSTGTFQIAFTDAPQQLQQLIATVNSFNLQQGIENSLDAKLQNAEDALTAARTGDMAAACNRHDAFINEVLAQTGKKITAAQAEQLIAAANRIKAVLGCPPQ